MAAPASRPPPPDQSAAVSTPPAIPQRPADARPELGDWSMRLRALELPGTPVFQVTAPLPGRVPPVGQRR